MNAASDLTIANTDYALLGFQLSTVSAGISIKGPDVGNLRVSCPGAATPGFNSCNWFVWLSEQTGKPCIPVINSANKGGTFFELVTDQALAAVTFSAMFMKLTPA